MSDRLRNTLIVGVIFGFVFVVGGIKAINMAGYAMGGDMPPENKKMWADSRLNKPAPLFEVQQWIGSEPEMEGKMVLIDFWATWCGPCRQAIPHLNEFHHKYGDRLVVVGVSDEERDKVAGMKSPKIEYFNAIDTSASMKNQINVRGIPHIIVVDPQGIVRWEGFPFLPGHELDDATMLALLDKYVPVEESITE